MLPLYHWQRSDRLCTHHVQCHYFCVTSIWRTSVIPLYEEQPWKFNVYGLFNVLSVLGLSSIVSGLCMYMLTAVPFFWTNFLLVDAIIEWKRLQINYTGKLSCLCLVFKHSFGYRGRNSNKMSWYNCRCTTIKSLSLKYCLSNKNQV